MEKQIDEKTARYMAISEMAALLRDSLTKTCILEGEGLVPKTEYGNAIFGDEQLNTVKRTFMKMCSEV